MGTLLSYAKSFYLLLGNRRRFARMPMSGAVLATPRGSAIISPRICSVLDISLHGMGVDCSEPMAVNQFLDIQSEDYGPARLARVCYCVPHESLYRVGLEIITLPS